MEYETYLADDGTIRRRPVNRENRLSPRSPESNIIIRDDGMLYDPSRGQTLRTPSTQISRRNKRKIAFVIASIIACIVFVVTLMTVVLPNQKPRKYERAIQLLDNGDYMGACVLLNGLDYKDSASILDYIVDNCFQIGLSISFGSYEQDNNKTNGKEEIDWLILDKEDNRILVTSRYALDWKKYNNKPSCVTWETCSLREWLNTTFLNTAFTSEEQGVISEVTVRTEEEFEYGIDQGNDTMDQIFLLSLTEVGYYFESNDSCICTPTQYTKSQGKENIDNYKEAGAPGCYWWLRATSDAYGNTALISYNGNQSWINGTEDSMSFGVRPAFWINLKS